MPNQAASPNRRQRIAFAMHLRFDYYFCAQPSLSAAAGEPQRKSMSRSVHTSRAKFRKAFQFDYSSDEERQNVLGKIIDEKFLKRDLKEDAKRKRQSKKAGLRSFKSTQPIYGVASKKARATSFAKDIVKSHERKGYGTS